MNKSELESYIEFLRSTIITKESIAEQMAQELQDYHYRLDEAKFMLEELETQECELCAGSGAYDSTRNCEEYDDFQFCPECAGKGRIDVNE